MLVLARQLNERIVLPTVGATIEVVAIKPGSVRLGIEAPPEVTILREEVYRRGPPAADPKPATDAESRLVRVQRVLRNRLDAVALGLASLRQRLAPDPLTGAGDALARLEDEVRSLQRQLEAVLAAPPSPTAGRLPARGAACHEGNGDCFAI